MATTDENKAARTQQSQEVARDAAEAYRAAVAGVMDGLKDNVRRMKDNDDASQPMARWRERRQALRDEARELVKQGRQLGIDVTKMANALGVSRQTAHVWINEGES